MSTPAGWYSQPDGQQRYWDGESWTENVAPGGPPVMHPAAARKSWFVNHKVLTGAGAALLLVVFMGIAYGNGTKSITAAPVADSVATSTAPDQAALNKAAADKAAADKAAADKATADQAAADKAVADKAAADKAVAPAPEVFTMPNLVGENLQLGQDKLQALGSYLMDQQDAAGLGRIQVLDSNWQVCTQDPAPGATVPVDTMVTLAAVKLAETCP